MAMIWATIILVVLAHGPVLGQEKKESRIGIPVGGRLNFTCDRNNILVFTYAHSSKVVGIHRHLNSKCSFKNKCAITRKHIVSVYDVEVADNLIVNYRCVIAQDLYQSCRDVSFLGNKDNPRVVTSVNYPFRDDSEAFYCTFKQQVPPGYMLTLTILDCYGIRVFMDQDILCNGSTKYGSEIQLHSTNFVKYNIPGFCKGGLLPLIRISRHVVTTVNSDGVKGESHRQRNITKATDEDISYDTLVVGVLASGAIVFTISTVAVFIICQRKRQHVTRMQESGGGSQINSATPGTQASLAQISSDHPNCHHKEGDLMHEANEYDVPGCSSLGKVCPGKCGTGESEKGSQEPKKPPDEEMSDVQKKTNAQDGKRGENSAGYEYDVVDVMNFDHLEKPRDDNLKNIYQEIQEKVYCNRHDSGSISKRMSSACSNIYQDIPEHNPIYMTLEAP